MSLLSNLPTKNRSSTFGGSDFVTSDRDACQRRNLIVSPIRSAVSGMSGVCSRKRSSTWHGTALQVDQVDSKEDLSFECLITRTAPCIKRKLCQIITEELNEHLENEKDLKSSQEFVEKSGMLAKIISTRARQLIGCNTKIVSSVFIGEIRGDGIEVASQCLFDPSEDAFASGNFKSPHIFAIGTLFVTAYDASQHT